MTENMHGMKYSFKGNYDEYQEIKSIWVFTVQFVFFTIHDQQNNVFDDIIFRINYHGKAANFWDN